LTLARAVSLSAGAAVSRSVAPVTIMTDVKSKNVREIK